jgi:HK97 family phage major capsid protein
MEKIQELRAARAGKIDALDALIKKMGVDDYVENDVDTQVYEEIKKEVGDLDKRIARTEEVDKLKASLAKPVEGQAKVFATPRKRFTKLKAFKGPDAEDNAYATGQWLKASVFGDEDSKQWCRDNGISLTRAHSESVNSAGGVLVPSAMMDSIIDLREEFGVFRKNAKIVPMSSDTLDWPRRTGGLTAYFTPENTAGTESTAAWDNVSLVAKKLMVLTRMSTELSEDAVVSVADILTSEIAYAFASKEDDCGFNGDGSSTYGGIRGLTQLLIDSSHTAGKVAAAAGHPTFANLDATDLTNLIGKLPAYALPNAKFYISQLGFATVFERLIASAGGNSISTLNGEIQYRYLGFPIIISQKMPAVSTTLNGSIMMLFGDLAKASAMGERRSVTIKRSDERYFDADQIGLLGTERVDIVNHDLGDNTNAGPIVGLVGTT